MSCNLRRRVGIAAIAALVASTVGSFPALAEDPTFIPWSELLPGLTFEFNPSSENLCNRGDTRCVDAVIREMERRLKPLAKSCNHNAIFSLTYLLTTQEYRRTIADPSFFSDTPFVNHEDVVFASLYFKAYDDWYGGRRRLVPAAWRTAFDAADTHRVSGAGSLLLGMSAHINRDLPFALAAIGLITPEGDSRKPDHDKVNRILNRVIQPVINETSRRFDPPISSSSIDGTTLDETGLFQIVAEWREEAWRNAERLKAARSPSEWSLVAQSIEQAAATKADAIVEQTRYREPMSSSAARDAYCAEHWDDV